MKHDEKCELSVNSWHMICNCGSRALKKDPLPDDMTPIYPWAPDDDDEFYIMYTGSTAASC